MTCPDLEQLVAKIMQSNQIGIFNEDSLPEHSA